MSTVLMSARARVRAGLWPTPSQVEGMLLDAGYSARVASADAAIYGNKLARMQQRQADEGEGGLVDVLRAFTLGTH